MRKKNLLEYILLGLFILCMALALTAALGYVTRATEREFLNQGKWLFSMLGIALALFLTMRLTSKESFRMTLRQKKLLVGFGTAIFFAAGLAARLYVINRVAIEPSSDFETYYMLAKHLVNGTLLSPEGKVYREYVALYPHTIGFPMLILRPVFTVFGVSVKNALYANLACSMVSILLAGRIGRRCAGRMGGLIATGLMSLWPSHILYSDMVASEPSFTMMILLATCLMVEVLDRRSGSLYDRSPGRGLILLALMGVVLALGGAIRPMAVILLAAYAVVQLMAGGDTKYLPKHDTQIALSKGWLCLVIVVIPYLTVGAMITSTISTEIMEKPVSGVSASGYNLMVGVNTKSQGLWNQEDADFFKNEYTETGSATAAHSACMQKALERIKQSPEDVLNLFVYKFRDLWGSDDFGIDWNLLWTGQQGLLTDELTEWLEGVRPVGRVMYLCVLMFSLIGAINAWRRTLRPRPMQMVCILFFLGTALSHMLLETQVRYHYNMIPYLILLTAMAASDWRQRMAEEPVIQIVVNEPPPPSLETQDHTHFDIGKAIEEGHIRLSVSEAYEKPPERKEKQPGSR